MAKRMNFNSFKDYQCFARDTAIYPNQGKLGGLTYSSLGLVGEAGEIANKVKKILRDDYGVIQSTKIDEIGDEIGDVLWYLANICEDLGIELAEVAEVNLNKLYDRKERGVLKGSGDKR